MASKVIKIVLTLAALALVGHMLYSSRAILFYLIVASILALIGRPIYNALLRIPFGRRRMPSAVAAAITLFTLIGSVALALTFFIPAIITEGKIIANLDTDKLHGLMLPMHNWANEILIDLGMAEKFHFGDGEMLGQISTHLNFTNIGLVVNGMVGVFGNFLVAFFSVAFISFFFINEPEMVPRLLNVVTPKKLEPSMERILQNTRRILGRYFIGLVVQVLAVSLCLYIGLSIIGVKHALTIAIFGGIANLVPYLGPWIGCMFAFFVIMANAIQVNFEINFLNTVVGLVVVYFGTQMIDNYFIQPTIFSNSISAHPLEIFLVILAAGMLGGIGAMIAAVPFYAFLRIVFTEMNREFGWMEWIKNQ